MITKAKIVYYYEIMNGSHKEWTCSHMGQIMSVVAALINTRIVPPPSAVIRSRVYIALALES